MRPSLWATALLVALAALGGCSRKAPGPAECRRFAYLVHGVRREADLERSRRVREEVDNVTRECLTTPYDRELLRCVEETGRTRSCRAAFALRHANREPLLSP